MKKTTFENSNQVMVTETVECTPGNLAELTAHCSTTVTNLTVTGTIDARDFKTMNEMSYLKVLDLSGATIEAYTGPAYLDFFHALFFLVQG